MAYITRADIEALYGASYLAILCPAGVDVDGVVARAAESATGEADLYLCKRYAVPLAVVPEGIKAALIDLACYRLASTHERLTEEISERAKAARKLLEMIAAGKAGLGTAEPSTTSTPTTNNGDSSADGASFEAAPRMFRRGMQV